MKKLLPILSIALVMTACTNSARNADEAQTQKTDTSGLAAFNDWKAQESAIAMEQETVQYATATPVKKQAVKTSARKSSGSSASNSGSNSNSGNNTDSNEPVILDNESSQPAKAEEKKGWSKAAKGAVIGGVAGAAGGAAIHKKNRVVGAVVGAVIGAGGGYAIGRGMDKKDGRYLIPQ